MNFVIGSTLVAFIALAAACVSSEKPVSCESVGKALINNREPHQIPQVQKLPDGGYSLFLADLKKGEVVIHLVASPHFLAQVRKSLAEFGVEAKAQGQCVSDGLTYEMLSFVREIPQEPTAQN